MSNQQLQEYQRNDKLIESNVESFFYGGVHDKKKKTVIRRTSHPRQKYKKV